MQFRKENEAFMATWLSIECKQNDTGKNLA